MSHGNCEMRRSRRAFVGGAAAQRRGERGGGDNASRKNNNNLLSVSSSSRGIADGVRCRASLLAGTQGWDEGGAYQGKRATAGYDAVDDVSDEAAQGAVLSDVDGPEGVKRDAGNEAKWGFIVKLTYAAVSVLIVANLFVSFFPAGFNSTTPAIQHWGEMMVMASGALLGGLNFGPQASKQVRGGLKALDQIGGTRAAASEFLGLVMMKMIFDLVGLVTLAVPAVYLPGWVLRTAGIGVTMLAHGSFVSQCKTTFNADGTPKPIPPKVRELIANADRTLAFLALAVAAGTKFAVPVVAIPAGALFLAGGVYFTAEVYFMKPKKPTTTTTQAGAEGSEPPPKTKSGTISSSSNKETKEQA